jgi:LL-diaminopimelate aminotransferase
MSEFIQNSIAKRMGGRAFGKTEGVYKFAKIKAAKREAVAAHPERQIIDMGVGEPDWTADDSVLDRLNTESRVSGNRFYADNGIPEFQQACIKYMEDQYGVGSLSERNVIHGIGSKPILAMIPMCFIDPGDVALVTTPGYPVLGTHTLYLGGEAYSLPLWRDNDFYPDLSTIPEDVLRRAKLLYINYPNNPTGQVATLQFYRDVIDFAHKHGIVVVSDAAYSALVFDGKPLSILSIDGAMDVAIEVHSLSKSFNMTGWRIAFVVGSETSVKLYGTVKDNTDSGQFRAIQKAACAALEDPSITQRTIAKYSRRFDLLVDALREIGFEASKPKGTFYSYVPIPKGTRSGRTFGSAEEVSEYLIKAASVSTVPWDDAGSFLRFSVTFEADLHEEEQIIHEMKERIKALDLVF